MRSYIRQLTVIGAAGAMLACAPTVQQEVQIGDQYSAEIERTMPMITDSRAVSAFNSSIAPLKSVVRRKDLQWEFRIVNSDQVNAFAVPGGHIYVFRGLIERAEHWDEFAGAVAHEIGHVDLRHSAEQMGQASAANTGLTLAYILLGRQPGAAEQVAVNIAGGAVFAKFSRDDEREADSMAVAYMTEARIDPSGLTRMFRRLQSLQSRDPSKVELWFSSHPMPDERITNVDRYINSTPGASAAVRTGRTDLSAFSTLQARLRALPDAPKEVPSN
ncbi:MAG TPA: M48 family metallopeptidase [Gemmatimonadales bacterium]|nr:M48 family metallopeptidase [Gemmatimonadales bacterium]